MDLHYYTAILLGLVKRVLPGSTVRVDMRMKM